MRWWAAMAAAIAVCGVGLAQPKSVASVAQILGQWRFETAVYDADQNGDGCQMSGLMTVRRADAPDRFTCSFTAQERCPHGQWRAVQTCTAVREGDRLRITSTILKTIPPSLSYAPDNWDLTIHSSDRMTGELRSADIAPVEFRRSQAPIS